MAHRITQNLPLSQELFYFFYIFLQTINEMVLSIFESYFFYAIFKVVYFQNSKSMVLKLKVNGFEGQSQWF